MNTFEQSLLTELREHVATRTPTPARSTKARRWRWAAVPAVAAAAVTAVVVAVSGPSPAYAVSENSAGDVTVTISSLEDADGLEKALAEHGIEAEVEYDANAPVPAPAPNTEAGLESGTGPDKSLSPKPADDGCTVTSGLSSDAFTLTVPAAWADSDAVLHLTTSGSADGGVSGLQMRWTGTPPAC